MRSLRSSLDGVFRKLCNEAYYTSGRITKKGKGSFLWSFQIGKGSFPFLAELSTGGGGWGYKWNENSLEICGKFQCLGKFVLTNERFRRAQAKMTEK